jgi:hypothetical protein
MASLGASNWGMSQKVINGIRSRKNEIAIALHYVAEILQGERYSTYYALT